MNEYFCILKESQFQCQIDAQNNYDICNLGKKKRIKNFKAWIKIKISLRKI